MSKHTPSGVSRLRTLISPEPKEPAPENDWAKKVLEARAKVQELAGSSRDLPAAFEARMALADEPGSTLSVRIDLDEERIEVHSDGSVRG